MRARGAMPLILPRTAAAPLAGTFSLPPAVEAVCEPCPSASRAELNSYGNSALIPALPP